MLKDLHLNILKFNKITGNACIFLLYTIFLAGGTRALGNIRENMSIILREKPLILYGENESYARTVRNLYLNFNIACELCKADTASVSLIKQHHIIALGTRNTNPFVNLCLEKIPISLTDTSVIIENKTFTGSDIRLVFTIPNPLNPDKICVVFTAQNSELIPGITFHRLEKWDFIAYRKSDGIGSDKDNIFSGNFKEKGLKVDALFVSRENPIELQKTEYREISLFYNTLSKTTAMKIAKLLHVMYIGITKSYKIRMPPKIFVYIYKELRGEPYYAGYTDSYNTIWQKKIKTSEEEFLDPSSKMILILAHEMSRLAFQPYIHDRSKRDPLRTASDDWCHYCQFTRVIPYIWNELGRDAWPVKYNYNEEWGEERFKKIYKGAEDTYAHILYKIDKKFGADLIGRVLNQVTENGLNKVGVDIELFMQKLGAAIGDTSIMNEIKNAWPTPLEHSFWKRMEHTGLLPNLDFWNNDFVIDSVLPGSPADSIGIMPGDVIVKINGFNVHTEKARAYRSVLQEIQNNGWIVFEIKRNETSISRRMKVRKK